MICVREDARLCSVIVTLEGEVTMEDLNRQATALAFEERLAKLHSNCTVLVDFTRVASIEAEVRGVMFYLAQKIAQLPGVQIFAVGDRRRLEAPRLRFIKRLAEQGCLRYFRCRAEADQAVEARVSRQAVPHIGNERPMVLR